MSAGGDSGGCRHGLKGAADDLFDAMYPEDLAALLARYDSRSTLHNTVVDRAGKVADKLAKTDEPVIPDEYVQLIAACLTWGRQHAGVHQNTSHAAQKFSRYRRFPELPPEILVRVGRIDPDDDRVIALLARSLRIRTKVTNARSAGEPELILNMLLPAIVAALAQEPDQPSGPAADAALVGTALDVLERGAVLAAEYRVARRPVPGVGDLPIVGNADFLVRIAAYRLAIEERRGFAESRPLDGLQQAVADLAGILRRAMTRSVSRWGWRGPDEPDVATAFNQFASYLGSAGRDAAAGRRVSAVNTVLNYRLGLDETPDESPVEDPGAWLSSLSGGEDIAVRLSDIEYLVGWLLAALFHGAGPDTRQALLEWLNGTELTNQQEHLPLLVRRLRVATARLDVVTTRLDGEPRGRPPRPAEVTPSQCDAMAARLVAAVDPGDINGCTQTDARRLTLDALPSLWTRRRPAILLLAAHLRVLIGPGHSGPRKATLVATHGVRAPVQFVQPSTSPLRVPCCPDTGAAGRSATGGQPRQPAHYQEICPHRPWGEIGWVENYRTLGDAAGFTAEAVRRQLERYQGPWPELLWP